MFRFKSRGFLLLEVMLAVTILSLGLVWVLRSFISVLGAVRLSQDLLSADLLLEEKLWQKQQQQSQPSGVIVQDEQGQFDPPWDNFSYAINYQQDEDTPFLYQSRVSVSWQQKKKDYSSSCVTYVRSKKEE